MTGALESLAAVLAVIGGCFGLVGSYGLFRLRVPMQRLHAPTKAMTMGVVTAAMASALELYARTGELAWHIGLIAAFLFVTAPVSALFIAKTHLHRTPQKGGVPKAPNGVPWAGDKAAAPPGDR